MKLKKEIRLKLFYLLILLIILLLVVGIFKLINYYKVKGGIPQFDLFKKEVHSLKTKIL